MTERSSNGCGKGPEGSRVRHAENGRAKRVKTGGAQWSDEAEDAFFDHLAATCNVRAAAAAVGFTTFTVYRQRRLRPDFAEKWRLALEQGYVRLEMALVEAANDSLEDVEFDADRPIPKMTVEQAMNVLRAHRNEVLGLDRRGPGRHALPKGIEHYRASILRKIAAIRAARDAAGAGAGRGVDGHRHPNETSLVPSEVEGRTSDSEQAPFDFALRATLRTNDLGGGLGAPSTTTSGGGPGGQPA